MSAIENTISSPETRDEFTQSGNLDEQSRLEIEIATHETRLKELRARIRYEVGAAGILFFASQFLTKFPGVRIVLGQNIDYDIPLLYFGVALAVLLVIHIAQSQYQTISMQAELDLLIAKKRIFTRFENPLQPTAELPVIPQVSQEQPAPSYFDSLVRINVDNLAEYYSLVKVHTDNSFRVSIVAGVTGFVLLATGVIIGFVSSPNAQTTAYLASASGIVTEFISGIFFYLYNRTIRELKGYHDSLLAVQNILLSFKIVGDIQDEKEKIRMVGQMLSFLISKQSVPTPSIHEKTDVET